MNAISVEGLDRLRRMGATTLARTLATRNNNFNLLRLIAASLVIYAHSFPLLLGPSSGPGGGAADWFYDWTGIIAGGLAVQAFFVMSGIMVTQSFERSRTVWIFIRARILRIYPALVVCVLLCALMLGPAMTSVGLLNYLSDARVWRFIAVNSSLTSLEIQLFLPGVFESNPISGYVNGSLWTLPWEILMYVGLTAAGVLGLLRGSAVTLTICLCSLLIYISEPALGEPVFRHKLVLCASFSSYFFVGVLLYLWRERIKLNWITLGVSVAVWTLACSQLREHPLALLLYVPALAYLIINLASVPGGFIRGYGRFGDYSYGTYIYAYPVQQLLVSLYGFSGPLSLTLTALLASWALAFCSWHLIESPALKYK
ncbi:MAG: acyltransferase family protein [Nevskiales bacterium]